ncbi:hypothetical protein [Pseudomonas sp. GL-R-26]|uniref:hypothetical protein n=1 Tax=Pseudomonas sp. GL-R-26 TaxID=2832392 RepID=UPI001CBC121E|nr:hypothetical protein [Pseudomonas sp. GL-R-26]
MADFSPRLEAWTRYSQEALGAIIIAKSDLSPAAAALEAADYADRMLDIWLQKAGFLKQQKPNPDRE